VADLHGWPLVIFQAVCFLLCLLVIFAGVRHDLGATVIFQGALAVFLPRNWLPITFKSALPYLGATAIFRAPLAVTSPTP
jgi:hypothetical protein